MSDQRRLRFQRIGALTGIAAPILAFACILTAVASYPAFSWTGNALSDLGVVSGVTALTFNFGLFFSGLLGLIFAAFGLFSFFEANKVGESGSAIFAAAAVALVCIGIFNEHFSPTHYLFSVAFFTLAPISLLVLTIAFWLQHQRGTAVFTILIAIAAALPWILEFTLTYVPDVAIPETISGLAFSIWTIAVSAKMLG